MSLIGLRDVGTECSGDLEVQCGRRRARGRCTAVRTGVTGNAATRATAPRVSEGGGKRTVRQKGTGSDDWVGSGIGNGNGRGTGEGLVGSL